MKQSAIMFALAVGLSSLANSGNSFARESISSLDARVKILESNQLEATDKLNGCGGTYAIGGQISNEINFINPSTGDIESLGIPSPSTGGILVDGDASSMWDYGYISTQLYTDEDGKLKCGATLNVQELVQNIVDFAGGAVCAYTGLLSLDPRLESVDTVACGVLDNAVRAINAHFWLGVSGYERAIEILDEGSLPATKGEHSDLFTKPSEIGLLTVGIPSGPADLIDQMKQQAIYTPMDALSRGKILVGSTEIDMGELPTPFDIVLAELQSNGELLLETPALFVASTAEEMARQFFDAIVPLVIDTIIAEAGKLDFVDQDGHQVFGMGLKNDGTGTGLNAMGFNVSGTEMMSISEGDVCMNGLCISTIGSFINSLPGDFPEQINGLKDRVTTIEGLVPADLDTQLANFNNLNTDFTNLNNRIPDEIERNREFIDTMWHSLYTERVAAKANDLWELMYTGSGTGGLLTKINNLDSLVPSDLTTQLSNFSTLNTQFNNLKDSIPSDLTTQLSNFSTLNTQFNNLKDSIPSDLTTQLSNFSTLNTQFNNLKDSIPSDLKTQLSNFKTARHTVNELYGLIHTETFTPNYTGGIITRLNVLNDAFNLRGEQVGDLIEAVKKLKLKFPDVPCPIVCSDGRLKTNIQPLSASLEKLLRLEGVSHSWNEDAAALGIEDLDRTVLGFIAQDVQQVVPELVTEAADGYLRLDYGKMAPLMVEGIKEQQTQIAHLQHENAQLKGYLCSMDPAAPFCAN